MYNSVNLRRIKNDDYVAKLHTPPKSTMEEKLILYIIIIAIVSIIIIAILAIVLGNKNPSVILQNATMTQ
jgi:hypothetical protein